MNTLRSRLALLVCLGLTACGGDGTPPDGGAEDGAGGTRPDGSRGALVENPARYWNGATIYFLLTDRFRNGDPSNDDALGRTAETGVLRDFEGGDLAGVMEMLEAGYFTDLGVDALWMTPFWEQIHGVVDEGTGPTYGYHGYWARDWTTVDPAWGTNEELARLVALAHEQGIRVILDAVIQHTGPVTPRDPLWEGWVRTDPPCTYRDYETTVECELVDGLPDLLTGSDEPVPLPDHLVAKWDSEGRLEEETAQLDAWFAETGYPRAPRYYVMKWLTDWVRELGFDGYRVDTAKHFQEDVSLELAREARRAFREWKEAHPDQVLDDLPFWMMAEVYNYEIGHGREFDFGDRTVDFYAHGYDALINFSFKWQADDDLDAMYQQFATTLREGELAGVGVVNYASSHDDSSPLDRDREEPFLTGTRLLLAPGTAQIYYGDELARPLEREGAVGDANLRTFMNWEDLESSGETQRLLSHWQRLGRFRARHPAVGAGAHRRLRAEPYVFSRSLVPDGGADRVVVGMELPPGRKTIPVGDAFEDGSIVHDFYSGARGRVDDGRITLETPFELVLLEASAAD